MAKLYDLSKLRGRIIEKFKTLNAFAEAFGITRQCMSLKMTGATDWTRDDMVLACKLLDIPLQELHLYFFVYKCDK